MQIVGNVVDQEGAPVPNATVTLLSERWMDVPPLEIAMADQDGKFAFHVAPGTYGLGATAEGLAASFSCGHEVSSNGDAPRPTIMLGGSFSLINGSVRDEEGNPVPRADVWIVGHSTGSCDGLVTRSNSDGSFRAQVPPSGFSQLAVVGAHESRSHFLKSKGEREFSLVAHPAGPRGAAPLEVVNWIRENAVVLATTNAGSGHDDLAPLREFIGDARVVALGEASHGTREFFQLKHRMLEFLVEEIGFTAFVIEATMPEAFHVNEYVEHGRGDAAKALAGMYFWVWNTQEVLALIEWMRTYNANPKHSRKVRFYGNDCQFSSLATRLALDHLRTLDPKLADVLAADLEPVADEFFADNFRRLDGKAQGPALVAARKLLGRLERENSPAWSKGDLATQHARIVVQFIEVQTDEMGGYAIRDRAMASNTEWALEREGADGKVVVWAHNGHVSRLPYGAFPSMGLHLDRRFGAALRVFGFAFGSGRYQATDYTTGNPSRLREFEVDRLEPGSLDRMLSRVGSNFVLNLKAIPADGPVDKWFRPLRNMRNFGSASSETAKAVEKMDVRRDFDALIFVNRTTAAKPNHSRDDVRSVIHPGPVNLDFEEGTTSEPLKGWRTGRWLSTRGYKASVDRARPKSGMKGARVQRDRARRYGFRPAELTQRIDAAPFAGKTVVVTFHARSLGSDPVYVFTQSPGPNGFQYHKVTDSNWTEHKITLGVAAKASGDIRFGLAVTGESTGWLDTITVTAN